MANLAIKGHATRGKEVIEILEMLGGKISHECKYKDGFDTRYAYFIDTDEKSFIDGFLLDDENLTKFSIFTVEELLEKFPYKVGDKVLYYENPVFITKMEWIEDSVSYHFYYKGRELMLPSKHLQPYKELETMEEQTYLNPKLNKEKEKIKESLKDAKRIIEEQIRKGIPIGYEFASIDDNNKQIILNKIEIQYPTTYEECCEVLGLSYKENKVNVIIYNIEHGEAELYRKFIELKRCRDAYWKLYGKQIGLKEPWKPIHKSLVNNTFYTINCFNNEVSNTGATSHRHSFLEFPTEEMRDMFFNNFKDVIEFCKELI